MRLTHEEISSMDWNQFSVEDIECLIDIGCVTDDEISHHYRNNQWRDRV